MDQASFDLQYRDRAPPRGRHVGEMVEVAGHHDAAAHDPERSLGPAPDLPVHDVRRGVTSRPARTTDEAATR